MLENWEMSVFPGSLPCFKKTLGPFKVLGALLSGIAIRSSWKKNRFCLALYLFIPSWSPFWDIMCYLELTWAIRI